MPRYCAVRGCNNSSKNTYMHNFTKREPGYQQSLKAVGREDLYEKCKKTVTSSHCICDVHFNESCKFPRAGLTNLKIGSVPTLFLDATVDVNSGLPTIPSTEIVEEIHTEDPLRFSPEPPAEEKPFDPRCRICLIKTENGIPLDHRTNINAEDSRSLCEILNRCSKAEIAIDDNKPQSLCIDCVEKARIAYEFSICCERSESVLQKELENVKEQDSDAVIRIINVNEFVKTDETCKISQKPNASPMKNESGEPSETATEKSTKCEQRLQNVDAPSNTLLSKKCVCTRKAYSSKDNKRKSAVTTTKRILCVQCCKNFSGRARFKFYTNVLIGKKRYHCSKCGARFTNPRNLKLHIVSHEEFLSYKYPKLFLM